MVSTLAQTHFVADKLVEIQPPPSVREGMLPSIRRHLFPDGPTAIATLFVLYLVYLCAPPLIRFLFVDAVWTGSDGAACRAEVVGREVGACWAFVGAKLNYFIYGSYPVAERWRVDVFFVALTVGIVWLLWRRAPWKLWGVAYFFLFFPLLSYVMLLGNERLGLAHVPTSLWGGVLVTLVVSTFGIVFSLPLGVLLALGRRSELPLVKYLSVGFIETIRGVPLITVLIMANTMLPLFLPQGITVDRLARPLLGVAIFASAYMAEVIRGGLQAIPKGQFEGAMSLGLSYWQCTSFIILPQALRLVIPGIVNTFIGLFKDTSLVAIVGIFDLIKTVEAARIDPAWAAPTVNYTGYAFAAAFYFVFCWGMSKYSAGVERRLSVEKQR
ncbi:amino acid ABC transporter permease [Ensifer sp. Root423]|uniref:amino acid ABC transporter permease n=1 Tax=Ensifer sp. Root423 TaxID=1736534 RepID=UPI0007134064|nr:amino acid ABC transporter permease [Ensifer sp. Root423]KQX02952.1 amino acid ABC transporter permease [Ensifer sp. Root423]